MVEALKASAHKHLRTYAGLYCLIHLNHCAVDF